MKTDVKQIYLNITSQLITDKTASGNLCLCRSHAEIQKATSNENEHIVSLGKKPLLI